MTQATVRVIWRITCIRNSLGTAYGAVIQVRFTQDVLIRRWNRFWDPIKKKNWCDVAERYSGSGRLRTFIKPSLKIPCIFCEFGCSTEFDHPFSHVFIFGNMFPESHGFVAMPVTSSTKDTCSNLSLSNY